MQPSPPTNPWYLEPWPWLLMAGPLIVIFAGLYTARLAFITNDGLVTDDYYKKGLAAQQTLVRSAHAESTGLRANIRLLENSVTISLHADSSEFAQPTALTLTLSHPTRAGLDQTKILVRSEDRYAAALQLPAAGHWIILLEDDKKVWRLMGNAILPANGWIQLGKSNIEH